VGKKANIKTHDKQFFTERFLFAVRYGKDARQRSPLPCARKKTHGKDFHARQTQVFPL
jgi:hypothetical protein